MTRTNAIFATAMQAMRLFRSGRERLHVTQARVDFAVFFRNLFHQHTIGACEWGEK